MNPLPMPTLTTRLVLAIAIVLAAHAVLSATRVPQAVADFQGDLSEFPKRIGPWEGSDVTMDPRLYRWVGAADQISRRYESPTAVPCSLHIAAFEHVRDYLPHITSKCYTDAGWRISEEQTFALDTTLPTPAYARAFLATQNEQQTAVAFWYELGDEVVTDHDQYRKALGRWRGRDHRPSTVKVLISTPAADGYEKALERLDEFARLVFKQANGLQ